MGKLMLEYIASTEAKGRLYYYYRRNGRRIKLPSDPTTIEFIDAYNRTHASFEGKSESKQYGIGSVSGLVISYKSSSDFSKLSVNSKRIYSIYLREITDKLGDLDANKVTKRVFLEWRDTMQDKAGKANILMAVARILWSFGTDRGIVSSNPITKIVNLKTGERKPWMTEEIESFKEHADQSLKLALALGLYTGQRISDVIKMQWNHIRDGGIEIVQQKTKAFVWVPMHPELASLVSEAPKKAVTILTNPEGKPYTTQALKLAFRKTCNLSGLPMGCVFHGLRKTAAVMLAEAGCSNEQIKAITGHRTDKMVSHYTKGANQKVLATSAIDQLKFGRHKSTH